MEKWSKIPLFSPKRAKKLLGANWDPQDDKNNFFELTEYENPMVGKRIFYLSPIQKSLCDQTVRLGPVLDFTLPPKRHRYWMLASWIF